ncbi:transposase [Paenibacillus albus]|uniref:Transposase n=1 Tax=Paenibacillus albus TaxID=2495582 RepID=A0A3S9AAG9_9BACL|nr:transposase [Paenibacillus albus]AZN42742.1 transposase [Paenibacillus albus]
MAIDHDRLFKEMVRTYFEEFMLLFFPQAFEAIDFGHLTFLSEELFTDVVAGEKYKVDFLIETRLKGEEALIIVHLESQAQWQSKFPERMFIYFSRLYEKYRRPILPIAIFSYDEARDEPDSFQLHLPFQHVLDFSYCIVELRKKDWRQYIKQDNPIAAAMLCKMGYTKDERVQVKKEFLRMLVRLEIDPARMRLITGFFDTYLILNDIEKQELEREIQTLIHTEEEKVMELMELKTQWEKDAELKGMLAGQIAGAIEGERKIVSKFIKSQFSDASSEMLRQLEQIADLDILDRLSDRLFQVRRSEDAQKLVDEAYQEQQQLR